VEATAQKSTGTRCDANRTHALLPAGAGLPVAAVAFASLFMRTLTRGSWPRGRDASKRGAVATAAERARSCVTVTVTGTAADPIDPGSGSIIW